MPQTSRESAPADHAGHEARRAAMALLARCDAAGIASRLGAIDGLPAYEDARAPERGLVMVSGRIGGDGAPFHLGEATVARAAVRLASGEVGFAYVLGRDGEKARLVALCDALMQRAEFRHRLERCVLDPLRDEAAAADRLAAERAAATRVDFFTMVRGED